MSTTINSKSMNQQMNQSSPTEHNYHYHFYKTEQLTFLCILFIMILVGNISVLITLLISKKRKSRMNFFMMHLAIAGHY
uniref:G-protein coupled receptors family 1 profile domain-containing protein n=1 Tax=Tetranychus urticae TaxID=32264 RepID=T1K0K8_TETUR